MNEISGVVTLARSLDADAANSLTIMVLAEVSKGGREGGREYTDIIIMHLYRMRVLHLCQQLCPSLYLLLLWSLLRQCSHRLTTSSL